MRLRRVTTQTPRSSIKAQGNSHMIILPGISRTGICLSTFFGGNDHVPFNSTSKRGADDASIEYSCIFPCSCIFLKGNQFHYWTYIGSRIFSKWLGLIKQLLHWGPVWVSRWTPTEAQNRLSVTLDESGESCSVRTDCADGGTRFTKRTGQSGRCF